LIYVLVMFMDGTHPVIRALAIDTTQALRLEAEERRARHLRILTELAEIGMELVQHVRLQVLEEVVPPGVDPVLAFARLAKAVRQTVALEAKVAAGGFDTPRLVARGAAKPEGPWRSWDSGSKAKVRQKVEEAIASGAEPEDAENLLCDLNERLDDPEYGDEMSDRPIGLIVSLICSALGVEVDLKHFSDAEMGFDTEAMKSPARVSSRPPLDLAASAVSVDGDGGAPVWPPRVGTGLGLSSVSRHATGFLKTRSETDTRFSGRPKPYD
jgi:hypothetical protein